MEDNRIVAERKAKFDAFSASTSVAYPNDFRPTHTAAEVLEAYDGVATAEELEKLTDTVAVAGRVMFLRLFGKFAFCKLQDRSGQIQVSFAIDVLGEDGFEQFKNLTDVGDLIGVTGTLTRTKTGELTVKAATFRMLNKTLRPLPDKFHGLTDVEQRYRMRYVDLMMNADVRDVFQKRAAIIREMRDFFHEKDFIEVETPMLQVQHGGAAARPFKTHHNALDLDLTLRIAPELYLKRLVVGGLERVFEINRNFRNEGVSVRHNPEFTMMEAYHAHMDYNGMMDFVEEMVTRIAEKVCGGLQITYGEYSVNMARPWRRLKMRDAVKEIGGASEDNLKDLGALQAFAKSKGIKTPPRITEDYGLLLNTVFEELCEDKLINPTFITDHPKAISPLARSQDDTDEYVQRAELFVVGRELSNLFSELNDPQEQALRFAEQVAQAGKGDDEAMPYDHDYVRALEYGLMPCAGVGIGIDRLVMLLANQPSIREVILFPTLRPEGGTAEAEAEHIHVVGE
ncbi:MAG: lysine--tRNA ligase [Proteobacteria bacterium]|nr:lysine--tRNA ligase [Pseudomonadota bacterium]